MYHLSLRPLFCLFLSGRLRHSLTGFTVPVTRSRIYKGLDLFQTQGDIDVGLLLKLQNKVKVLERERDLLRKKIEDSEDDLPSKSRGQGITNDSAFDALKVHFWESHISAYRAA